MNKYHVRQFDLSPTDKRDNMKVSFLFFKFYLFLCKQGTSCQYVFTTITENSREGGWQRQETEKKDWKVASKARKKAVDDLH